MGSKRGFSSMDPEKQREIASKGGKAAHQKGTAHEFTTEEARVAGRKGGAASRARRTSTSGGDSLTGDAGDTSGQSNADQNRSQNAPEATPQGAAESDNPASE